MKNILFLIFIFCFSVNVYAISVSEKIIAYLFDNNFTSPENVFSENKVILIDRLDGLGTVIYQWNIVDVPFPEELPSDEESAILLENLKIFNDIQRQSQKPFEQRQYENAFFALTEQVLALAQDERAGQTPPVKLSFPELEALLEALFDTEMATATKLSIKLLSIDSALKRYNTLWWDDAIQHEIPEE